MIDIKEFNLERYLGKHIKSGLALDVSKNSTGLTVFRNGKIETYLLQTELTDDVSPVHLGYRMDEFLRFLLDKVEGEHFDVICVEEALTGINHKVNAVALALNPLVDYLIATKQITCDKFYRINNVTWKKVLRVLSGVSPIKKGTDAAKKEIIQGFQALNFELGFKVNDYKSWSAYKDSGWQDRLDSVGVLLGVVNKYFDNELVDKVKKRVSMKVFDTMEEAKAYAKYDLVTVHVSSSALLGWYKKVKDITNKSTTYIYRGASLGSFGVTKKIFDMYDTYYVVVNVKVG